jgi:hypothetical protein
MERCRGSSGPEAVHGLVLTGFTRTGPRFGSRAGSTTPDRGCFDGRRKFFIDRLVQLGPVAGENNVSAWEDVSQPPRWTSLLTSARTCFGCASELRLARSILMFRLASTGEQGIHRVGVSLWR